MRFLIALLLFSPLTACKYDETISGYTKASTVWTLVELDGNPFTAHATISFPSKGKVTGQAPCNSYSGIQSVPLPWFKVDQITATEMACPDLDVEQEFFEALSAMSLGETLGGTMILSNESGREMVFKTTP